MAKSEVIKARTSNVGLAPFDRIMDTLGSADRQTVVVRGSGRQYDSVLGKGGVRGRSQVIRATRGGLVHAKEDAVRVPSLPQRNYIPVARQMPEG